jgi:putative CocE/NonD family hydrolase
VKVRLLKPTVFLASLALLITFAGWHLVAGRTSSAFVKANYTKHEYRIPMRDGVKLFTQIYAPKDTSQLHPFLVVRTPFSVAPYGDEAYRPLLGSSESFDKAGYIFVFQDVRGRFQSEGQFVDMRPHREQPSDAQADESRDMADTVDWLLKNVPGNNGRVGIWGISYPGFYTTASIIDSHPAIKAASPEAPVTNLFEGDDAYHNGAFMLAAQFQLYSSYFKPRTDGPEYPTDSGQFDYGTNDGYAFFLQHGPDLKSIAALIHNPSFDEKVQHDTYDDFWQARDISPHLHGIHTPVLTVGGWFDAEDLAGTLRTYQAIAQQNPGLQNMLVMGPWMHGGWVRANTISLGPLSFHENTSAFFRDQIAFPFFEHYLKDKPPPDLPVAFAYETGSNRWMRYGAWPPPDSAEKILYLHAGGKLSFAAPADSEPAFDQYISDPQHPVPFMEKVPMDLAEEFMFGDQRFASRRTDVLTFVGDPLSEDLTLAGPVSPCLQVSTSGTDSDFDVKLIDVYPDTGATPGYQLLVRGEPMRAKFRKSLSQPEAMLPDQVTPLNFDMPDVNHTFLRGHRIMVQIAGSWFPLTDLNPQRFEDIATALPGDFTKANERVYHSPQAASGIVVHVRTAK